MALLDPSTTASWSTHAANVIAASALRGTGDWEALPRLEDVRELLEAGPTA